MDPTTGEPLRDPVIEFANAGQPGGLSFTVVGGHVYRGRDVPELSGQYIYGGATGPSLAVTEGRLFASTPEEGGLLTIHELLMRQRARHDQEPEQQLDGPAIAVDARERLGSAVVKGAGTLVR